VKRASAGNRDLQLVLRCVDELRAEFRRVRPGKLAGTRRAKSQLVSALRRDAAKAAVEEALRDLRADPHETLATRATERELVALEAELGRDYGYKPQEVKGFVKRARSAPAGAALEIATVEDVVAQIDAMQERVESATQAPGGWWTKRREARAARKEADTRLFAMGAIVADATSAPLFELSYAVGVTVVALEAT
jgi:hypothetical protein